MVTWFRSPGLDDPVAVLQAGSQGLLDEHVAAAIRGNHCGIGVEGMRGADADHVQTGLPDHGLDVVVGLHPITVRKGPGPLDIIVAYCRKFTVFKRLEGFGVEIPHFTAADNSCF